ncbi:hypothetical protein [Leptospira meyeri]|uniref:hypothetical protein n=1 Tax=Leptospira meyeri TaxID=29508 RepID=UPI00223D70C1|nr:hypothetical protein [Leptospira meyeri]MCW7490862.1 hypothetical protein [Leptospira meyeri]
MKKILIIVSILSLTSCDSTRHTFRKINTNYLKKIDKKYNEYVIHFEYGFHAGRGGNPQIKIQSGIVNSLKNCHIQDKRIFRYIGFSKFLNSHSESLEILTNNYNGNLPKRIDLHLILDEKETVGNSYSNSDHISKHSSLKNNPKKLHNYNLYYYSITNPLINFEFLENIEYISPRFTDYELEDNYNFGKLFGIELCEVLKNIN